MLAALPAVERAVAESLIGGRGSVDELVAATGQPGATMLGALTGLELRGLVVETYGRYRPAGRWRRDGALAVGCRRRHPGDRASVVGGRRPSVTGLPDA